MALIRQEQAQDYQIIFQLIQLAFQEEVFSDHQEQNLVERLRASSAFVPELSLVAEQDGQLVGHILLSKIQIQNGLRQWPSLALAPVSVLPAYQGRGIGSALIQEAHLRAKKLGYTSVVLLGHAEYYPRFGYQPAHTFGIELPFEVPKENCMAIELVEKALDNVQGAVVYPDAFYGR